MNRLEAIGMIEKGNNLIEAANKLRDAAHNIHKNGPKILLALTRDGLPMQLVSDITLALVTTEQYANTAIQEAHTLIALGEQFLEQKDYAEH